MVRGKFLEKPAIIELLDRGATKREILHYREVYRGTRIVIKYGYVPEHTTLIREKIADNIIFVKYDIGANPILVHGGGKAITKELKQEISGYKPRFMDGDRYTDERIMEIVYRVLSNITGEIVDLFEGYDIKGLKVVGLGTSADNAVLISRSKNREERGLVGRVIGLESSFLKLLNDKNVLPVVCPIGYTPIRKDMRNVNADDAAAEIAYRTGAKGLFYLTDVRGVMNEDKKPIEEMSVTEAKKIFPKLGTGMDRKVETSITGIEKGVEAAYIFDGDRANALLIQMLTHKGVGTKIVR